MQSKESSDANSELFKEDDDEAMYKNPYEIALKEKAKWESSDY